MAVIKHDSIGNGQFINKYFKNRTVLQNKNVIGVTTGPTGSGKSYTQMSIGEGWYKYQFNEQFPIENVCFSLNAFMKRVAELRERKKARKGELFILEETGANFGNLDFQQKISKMFSYVLQSFRSFNLILLMNVPVFNMINKSARQLVHFRMTTKVIIPELGISKVDCKMHQINDQSGKSYWKFPRVNVNGHVRAMERMNFKKPSPGLIELYEREKNKFVIGLTEEFIVEAAKMDKEKDLKMGRKALTEKQQEVFDLASKGMIIKDMALELDKSSSTVADMLRLIRKKGYNVEKSKKSLRKSPFLGLKPQ